jgi:lipoprotein-anchoring transpeptidase ErfK/SrfK
MRDLMRRNHDSQKTARWALRSATTAAVLAVGGAVPFAVADSPTGCQSSGPGLAGKPTPVRSYSARLIAATGVRETPDISTKPFRYIRPTAPLGKGDVNLMITDRACDGHERVWLRVRVPQRPNGTQGWLLRDFVSVQANDFRVVIDQSERRMTVYEQNHVVMRAPVAVGKPETPTPFGNFAIAEKIYTNDPSAFIGPLVMPTTGFSETLNEYAGGNGRFAIHGTAVPQFIGTRASHGCIRMYNKDVLRLGKLVQPGTPILIQR